MLRRGGGAIVNVASEAAYKGGVADIGYTASKHGVVGLTTAAGLQYAKRGIRVNAVRSCFARSRRSARSWSVRALASMPAQTGSVTMRAS